MFLSDSVIPLIPHRIWTGGPSTAGRHERQGDGIAGPDRDPGSLALRQERFRVGRKAPEDIIMIGPWYSGFFFLTAVFRYLIGMIHG